MSNDKASEAREGLLDSVTGKAKEVAGAVSGQDDLVQEGQLQQAEAHHRKAAGAEQTDADAKRAEANQELTEAAREAAEKKQTARAQAQHEESLAESQRETEPAAAAAQGPRHHNA